MIIVNEPISWILYKTSSIYYLSRTCCAFLQIKIDDVYNLPPY